MLTSELIHVFHWIIYIGSIGALLCLFTKFRIWGALWIAILFASQAVFNGCLIVAWENYYRMKEGLALIPRDFLVDRFSSNHTTEVILSLVITAMSLAIVIISLNENKNNK